MTLITYHSNCNVIFLQPFLSLHLQSRSTNVKLTDRLSKELLSIMAGPLFSQMVVPFVVLLCGHHASLDELVQQQPHVLSHDGAAL